MSSPRIGHWLEDAGRRYCVELDMDRTVKAAWVQVTPHDKAPFMRRVVNPVTLAKLQATIRPRPSCPYCGMEIVL